LKIYAAGAPLEDEDAIMLLSALVPSPAYLCAIVEHSASPHTLEDETETVRYVRCIGGDIIVFWVPDLTLEQAAP